MTRYHETEQTLESLQVGLDTATESSEHVKAELKEIGAHIGMLSRGIDRGLKRSLEGLVFEGQALSSVMKDLAGSIIRQTYNVGISPITRQLSGAIAGHIEGLIHGVSPFANGGGFSQGRVIPFARGGVVDGPTTFPMRNGTGLMGEAGPEAIMPLERGPNGQLGVRASGGARPVNVTINISTPDVDGFRRSQSQIAAQVGRILSKSSRNQ